MWQLMAGGAALGALKGLKDQQQAERERKLAAQTAQWSPWTGMAPQKVTEANMLGDIAQGVGGGASLGQSMAASDYLNSLSQPKQAPQPSAAPTIYPEANQIGPKMQDGAFLSKDSDPFANYSPKFSTTAGSSPWSRMRRV